MHDSPPRSMLIDPVGFVVVIRGGSSSLQTSRRTIGDPCGHEENSVYCHETLMPGHWAVKRNGGDN